MTSPVAPRERFKVLFAGICALILMLGIARFSYTPLLPVMLQQSGLSMAFGGWLATINYAGYLAGALISASISDLMLKDRLYRIGLVVAIVSTVMMGLTESPWIWAVSRFIAGLSSAAGLLLGSGLILNWLLRHGQRGELGIHFSGLGLGIAVCAVAVKLTGAWLAWDQQWYALAALGVALAVPAWVWLPPPNRPSSVRPKVLTDSPPASLFMAVLMAAYFCAGVGYVVSATFIVAIIDDLPGLGGQGAWTFMVIGLAAAPASIVWDFAARRLGYIGALMAAFALHIPAVTLPIFVPTVVSAYVSAALFGLTFLGIVSLVLTMAGHYYPSRPAKMMGRMTISYGVAQILAPAITGQLAAASGSYAAGLWLAAGAISLGGMLLVVLKVLEARHP